MTATCRRGSLRDSNMFCNCVRDGGISTFCSPYWTVTFTSGTNIRSFRLFSLNPIVKWLGTHYID